MTERISLAIDISAAKVTGDPAACALYKLLERGVGVDDLIEFVKLATGVEIDISLAMQGDRWTVVDGEVTGPHQHDGKLAVTARGSEHTALLHLLTYKLSTPRAARDHSGPEASI